MFSQNAPLHPNGFDKPAFSTLLAVTAFAGNSAEASAIVTLYSVFTHTKVASAFDSFFGRICDPTFLPALPTIVA
jgi:hypothetical protein